VTPFTRVQGSYGTNTAKYNNALGFFVPNMAVLNHIFAFVPTVQQGIQFAVCNLVTNDHNVTNSLKHNWNNVGLRFMESGSVKISQVHVRGAGALGWSTTTCLSDPNVLSIPFDILIFSTIQLVFSNFYLGIAQGSVDFASKYTTTSTRAWAYGGGNKAFPTELFYIMERYGNFFGHLRAKETLADRAGKGIADIYGKYGANRGVTERERGEAAEWVASTKVVTTDTALKVTAEIFEVIVCRATSRKVDLDRFWRDVRTHSFHDSVA
jgi:alkylation response protein AidB-like acyl-CoA dehydrogenase